MSNQSMYFSNKELQPLRGAANAIGLQLVSNLKVLAGTLMGIISAAAASEVQALTATGTVSGGTFILVFGAWSTIALAWNSTAAQIQAALVALPNIGIGGVVVTGGPLPGTPITITFAGQNANLPQVLMTVTSSLTGSSPVLTPSRTTAGVAFNRAKPYASGNSDGSQLPVGFQRFDSSTNEQGMIANNAYGSGPQHGVQTKPETEVLYGGLFSLTGVNGGPALSGVDANAVTVLGARFLRGSLSAGTGELLLPGHAFAR